MQKSQLTLAMVIVASIATLVAICMIIAFSSCSSDTAVAPTPVPTHAHTATPTRTPTVAPNTAMPVPTHTPVTIGPPVLGGVLEAFIARYGAANDHSKENVGLYNFVRYPGSNIDQIVLFALGADGGIAAHRVQSITVQASDTGPDGWTAEQAKAQCEPFYPSDAKFQREIAVTGGYDRLYSSAALVTLFPASLFTDASQNQIAAGTFDAMYTVKASGLISSCSILIGQSQTK